MTAEPARINLARGLKLKNRVVKRLSKLDDRIASSNSETEDNLEFDVRELYKSRMFLAEQLVRLKVALNAANAPIQHLIYELAECKGLAALLARIDTKHGVFVEGTSGTRVKYIAQYRKADLDKELKRVEAEIDRIQDELDEFNHRTRIAVDASLLADDADEGAPV